MRISRKRINQFLQTGALKRPLKRRVPTYHRVFPTELIRYLELATIVGLLHWNSDTDMYEVSSAILAANHLKVRRPS